MRARRALEGRFLAGWVARHRKSRAFGVLLGLFTVKRDTGRANNQNVGAEHGEHLQCHEHCDHFTGLEKHAWGL